MKHVDAVRTNDDNIVQTIYRRWQKEPSLLQPWALGVGQNLYYSTSPTAEDVSIKVYDSEQGIKQTQQKEI